MSPSAPSVPPGPQLGALCRQYPHAPKVTLVPRSQIGRALEDALALDGDGWAGFTTRIVRRYAEQMAQPRILGSGRTALPAQGRSFLAARLLNRLGRRGRLDGLPGPQQMADTVADAIETLRRGGVAREDVRARIEADDVSATFRVVAACYEGYLEALHENDLYDDAHVFRWATERVRKDAPPALGQSVVAVCDAVNLPGRAHQFVSAVQAACQDFFRIGRPTPDNPPPQSAAGHFADVAPPSGEAGPEAVTEVNVCRAVGSRREVDAVFRDILADDVAFDEVEIAVAGEQPYASLIADRAAQLDLPVSLGTGVPAVQTRPGTALMMFLEWVTEDFDPAPLIRMLRSGLLRIDRVHSEIEDATGPVELEAHEVATLLAARRYEPGRDGYAKAFGRATEQLDEHIDDLESRGLDPDQDREQRRTLRFTHRLVQGLLDLTPRSASVQDMARNVRRFLERFGPVDPPPDDTPEPERTLDEVARTVLWQRLDRLTELPVDYEASATRLAALFRRWLEGQYVRAQHPRPGTVHVVPLESAGYGGRSHLYVVGMDGDTLSTAAVEDAMLRDPDRQALSESLSGVLPQRRSAPDATQWRHERALTRHRGALSLYTRVFDLDSGEERYPSPLFLRIEEAAASVDRTERILPPPDRLPISDIEAWLAATRAHADSPSLDGKTARDALREQYPWIFRGEAARRARQSDAYTVHDGLLAAGAYPELDFFHEDAQDTAVSAGRLETFAETPYLYFLKYILGVEPLNEPALDDEPWLNALRRGSILHATFEAFMSTVQARGETPHPEHEALLQTTLREALDDEIQRVAPPSEVVEEAAYRRLWEDALVFLQSEVEHCRTHEPQFHEVGFGFGPYRRQDGDLGDVSLTVQGQEMALRGRIDRVDRRPDGSLAVWDYKTGGASSFEEEDPLADGAQLQWALYAYALDALTGETVDTSGYYFPTAQERGTRLSFDPSRYRHDVERLLDRLSTLAGTGSFPMHPRARYLNAWRYRGYDRIFRDLPERSTALQAKTYPEDRPTPPSFG